MLGYDTVGIERRHRFGTRAEARVYSRALRIEKNLEGLTMVAAAEAQNEVNRRADATSGGSP